MEFVERMLCGLCKRKPYRTLCRAAVTALAERWTREQLPLERFRDMILLDQLREP